MHLSTPSQWERCQLATCLPYNQKAPWGWMWHSKNRGAGDAEVLGGMQEWKKGFFSFTYKEHFWKVGGCYTYFPSFPHFYLLFFWTRVTTWSLSNSSHDPSQFLLSFKTFCSLIVDYLIHNNRLIVVYLFVHIYIWPTMCVLCCSYVYMLKTGCLGLDNLSGGVAQEKTHSPLSAVIIFL